MIPQSACSSSRITRSSPALLIHLPLPPARPRDVEKTMPLPTDGLWTVRLSVTRRMPQETSGEHLSPIGGSGSDNDSGDAWDTPSLRSGGCLDHDPTDWVTIRIGPALSSLFDVASVKNVVNDDLGEVRHAGWNGAR